MIHKIVIATHILPQEIDQFERQINQLMASARHLDSADHIEIFAVLNVSPVFFNWDADEHKNYFVKRFQELKNLCNWSARTEFRVVDDNSMAGVVDFRRYIVRQYDQSITDIIFLDSDIYFHDTLI